MAHTFISAVDKFQPQEYFVEERLYCMLMNSSCQAYQATGKDSDIRRVSCHRCGNIRRKKNSLCTRCPHVFCYRCTAKMKDDYGPMIFVAGCPVCKELCCCGKNKSEACQRKHHCYRKCPASKKVRSVSSTDGPTGLNLTSLSNGTYNNIRSHASSSNSIYEGENHDWTNTEGQYCISNGSFAFDESELGDTCFLTLPRDESNLGPDLYLNSCVSLSENNVTVNGLKLPSRNNPQVEGHGMLSSHHMDQLPGIDTIQRARSLICTAGSGTQSAAVSGLTTTSGLPSSADNNFDADDLADISILFDPISSFGSGSPQYLSDQKFDFELNFLDDFIPEEYTWDSNVAPAISVSASGHREVLGALYQGITAQAPVVVSPTALLSPCYKTKGDSFDEQENILHSNKNTTYSSTQHCQMHIVEI